MMFLRYYENLARRAPGMHFTKARLVASCVVAAGLCCVLWMTTSLRLLPTDTKTLCRRALTRGPVCKKLPSGAFMIWAPPYSREGLEPILLYATAEVLRRRLRIPLCVGPELMNRMNKLFAVGKDQEWRMQTKDPAPRVWDPINLSCSHNPDAADVADRLEKEWCRMPLEELGAGVLVTNSVWDVSDLAVAERVLPNVTWRELRKLLPLNRFLAAQAETGLRFRRAAMRTALADRKLPVVFVGVDLDSVWSREPQKFFKRAMVVMRRRLEADLGGYVGVLFVLVGEQGEQWRWDLRTNASWDRHGAWMAATWMPSDRDLALTMLCLCNHTITGRGGRGVWAALYTPGYAFVGYPPNKKRSPDQIHSFARKIADVLNYRWFEAEV